MEPTTESVPTARAIEEELQELELHEKQLDRRTNRMLGAGIATTTAAVAALIVAFAALAVALGHERGQTVIMRSPAAGTSAGTGRATGARAGMGMSGAPAATAATSPRTINVSLGEMFVKPSKTSISAGKVTFVAHNSGTLMHELMIERVPLKMEGPGKPVEDAAQGMIQDMQGGGHGRMTVRLKPGTYELFCNVPGHYSAGQHTTFTVTKA